MIVFCHLLNDFSGSPKMLGHLINAIKSDITDDVLLVSSRSNGFLSELNCPVKHFHYRKGHSNFSTGLRLLSAYCQMFVLITWVLLVNRKKRDIALVCNTYLTWPAALAAYIFRVEVIWYIHETTLRPGFMAPVMRKVYQLTGARALFPSKFLQERECLKSGENVVLPNCLDSAYESESGSVGKRHRVLFVGSLAHYKGFEEFVAIAGMCPEFEFLAVLADEEASLEEFEFETPGNLSCLFRPEHLPEIYRQSLVVMNLTDPSVWLETFGLTIMEGMSQGCFYVAPVAGGHLEFCRSGEGILVASDEHQLIANYLKSLISGDSNWVEGSKINRDISKGFSSQAYRKRVSTIFRRWCGQC